MIKNNKKRKFLRCALLVVVVFAVSFLVAASSAILPKIIDTSGNKQTYATTEHGWNLILINKDNLIPEDYEVKLLKLSNGERVDERIYPDLQKMFDDARASGLELFVAQGYRTADEQQKLLEDKQKAYENEGNSPAEAKELAEKWVAVPGTSEHQLGIAVDINADDKKCDPDDVYKWLGRNAHKYGFINRYPADKTDITGIIYEPWHYRYVGTEAAKEIYEKGICLEEYIEQLETE
ncbi:MAG: M15 family metallopeptidase [Clostridia bacterium]|nr:M15 family metallopeptidase [Clostridia bacterium]